MKILVAALLAAVAAPAFAGKDAKMVPDVPVDAMTEGFLEGHPDLYYRNAGIEHDKAGDLAGARKRYLQAARYGDKPSQARLGEMYWNGQGLPADHVQGFLWMALAAERQYPMFTDMKMAYWNSLTPAERDQARQRDQSMLAEYGDAAAKPREERVMRRELSRSTGGMLGYNGQNMSITTYEHGSFGSAIDPQKFYAKQYWKPDLYWQTQDNAWRQFLDPQVDVGDVEAVHDGDAEKGAKPRP